MLWTATDGGISFLDGSAKPFHHYRAIPGNLNSLSDNRNPLSSWPLLHPDENYANIDLLIMNSMEACGISGQTKPEDALCFF